MNLKEIFSTRTDTKNLNFFDADENFKNLMQRHLGKNYRWAEKALHRVGEITGSKITGLSAAANKYRPVLKQYDQNGNRVDDVEYHPSYLEMKKISSELGLTGWNENKENKKKGHTAGRVFLLGMGYIFSQGEAGLYCPLCMTDGVVRILRKFGSKEQQKKYIPRLASMNPETFFTGAMFLTEKQGGSDVGAATTKAVFAGKSNGGDKAWKLYGDKWFCSNVDADVILTLARPENAPDGTKGLGMFLVPRVLDDGQRNHLRINRLKDKLGTCSMPTGEVTLEGAVGYAVGDVSKGFKYMAEMLNLSRLYNAVASCSGMRRGYVEALVYALNRKAFGKTVFEYPLVKLNLLDMVLETEASLSIVFHTLSLMDKSDGDAGDVHSMRCLRFLTPMCKYMTAKHAVRLASEVIEIFGGNGYIEDFLTPQLLRDAQVLPIWEGTTNILVLDVLRGMQKENTVEHYLKDVQSRIQSVEGKPLHGLTQGALLSLRDFQHGLERFAALKTDAQLLYSKQLTDRMYHLYALSLLLEEASLELKNKKSLRKTLIAELYYKKYFAPDEWKNFTSTNVVLNEDACDALFFFEKIRPEQVEALLEPETLEGIALRA